MTAAVARAAAPSPATAAPSDAAAPGSAPAPEPAPLTPPSSSAPAPRSTTPAHVVAARRHGTGAQSRGWRASPPRRTRRRAGSERACGCRCRRRPPRPLRRTCRGDRSRRRCAACARRHPCRRPHWRRPCSSGCPPPTPHAPPALRRPRAPDAGADRRWFDRARAGAPRSRVAARDRQRPARRSGRRTAARRRPRRCARRAGPGARRAGRDPAVRRGGRPAGARHAADPRPGHRATRADARRRDGRLPSRRERTARGPLRAAALRRRRGRRPRRPSPCWPAAPRGPRPHRRRRCSHRSASPRCRAWRPPTGRRRPSRTARPPPSRPTSMLLADYVLERLRHELRDGRERLGFLLDDMR